MSLYSSFRETKELVGFSPLLAKISLERGLIGKLLNDSNQTYKIHSLCNLLFMMREGHIVPTHICRSQIFVIASAKLLPKMIHSCIGIEDINTFFISNANVVANEYNVLYQKSIEKECSMLERGKCEKNKKCKWDGESCTICDNPFKVSQDMKRNLGKFPSFYTELKNTILEAYTESQILHENAEVPYYLFGLVLACYYLSIRSFSTLLFNRDISEEEWIRDYVNEFNLLSSDTYSVVEKTISGELKSIVIPQISMTHITKGGVFFPNCVETTLNNFFNVLLYNPTTRMFDLSLGFSKITVSAELCEFYEWLNSNLESGKLSLSDLDSYFVKCRFIDVVENLPGVTYRNKGLNIASSKENVFKVFSVLLGTEIKSLKNLEIMNNEAQRVEVKDEEMRFFGSTGTKRIKLVIGDGHSYAQITSNGRELFIKDCIAFSILNFLNVQLTFEQNFDTVIKLSYFYTNYINTEGLGDTEILLPILYYDNVKFGELIDVVNKYGKILELDLNFKNNIPRKLNSVHKAFVSSISGEEFDHVMNELEFPEVLHVKHCRSKVMPITMKRFVSLKILQYNKSKLEILSPWIGGFIHLTTLNLEENELISLPPEIGELKSLVELNLSANRLSSLPPEIGGLKSLKVLNLNWNKITTLPPEFSALVLLEQLEMIDSGLISVPLELSNLKSLTVLKIDSDVMTEFPVAFCYLSSLKFLRYMGRGLKSLPRDIGMLKSLTELYIGDDGISVLPPEIGNLKSLVKLSIVGNLTSIPPEIGNLESLMSLSLLENNLTFIPPEIGKLINLKELSLHESKLRNLPPEFGNLKSLTYLKLAGNRLTNIFSIVGNLTNLQILDVSGNLLRNIPPEIGNLEKLYVLELQRNNLTFIPPEIGKLINLDMLNLGINELKEIPIEIGLLKSLRFLELQGNKLTSIPREIGMLHQLTTLNLSGNIIDTLPPEVRELGIEFLYF